MERWEDPLCFINKYETAIPTGDHDQLKVRSGGGFGRCVPQKEKNLNLVSVTILAVQVVSPLLP